ncbi:hypothetical protein FS842_010779 [Serendipita sp. 407]|nr:hypothetical protein FS842_010779 [Serendipita sp. 407]
MDPSYLWQQPPHQDPGSSSEHLQTSQGLLQTNGTTRTSHSHQSSSTGWNADFGYVNGRLNPQAVQQAIPRQMYDPSWDTYGIYTDFDPNAALGIDPSTLMTAPNPSSASDPPTTIDPNLMMKSSQASLPQFISPSQTQLDPSQYTQPGYSTVYPLSAATSSLSAVMDYPVQDPMAPSTPTVSTSTRNGEPNGFHSTSEPLINQVKRILAPKKLDQDPNGTAAQLFELILPPTSEDSTSTTAITVDKEARMEILNRIRDYAPKEFWNQFGKNLRALNLLREWGRQASKKEEFTDTMMGWLQVVDKLPLTVEILIQSQLGKVVKWIVDHPPTKATKDMASKIKTNWEQLASAPQSESINSVKTAKKRKDETPAVKTPVAAGSPVTSGVTPPLKKLALTSASTVKPAVRRDSISSTTTPTAAQASSNSSAPVKGAQSDSSFFSAKPKTKLPSFRKKPTTGTGGSTPPSVKEESAQPNSDPNYNPFKDALRAMRKGSPQVMPSSTPSVTPNAGPGVSISAKTGKPKKVVRFAPDGELEKIKWIEKAIYDDDVPGRPKGFHGSYRDLDRFEGNLLKHMAAQIEWYEPQLVLIPDDIEVTTRGEFSQESKNQEEREASTLAAIYQVAPPDTPVEPPQLASMSLVADDSLAKTILLGSQIEELLQARQDEAPSATHWLGQLGNGLDSSFGANAGNLYAAAVEGAQTQPGQEGIAELLSKIMQSIPQTGGAQPPQDPYAGVAAAYGGGQPAAGDPAAAALLSALSALGGVPAQGYGAYGAGGDVYGGTTPSTVYGTGATGGLQPHAPTGTSTHDEEEERWRRSSKVDAKKTKAKQVPASQNTWRPLCTYFARGRCRFGENCDFSHDPAKLNQGS